MILPQSSSRTMMLPPGTAWHPLFHHSGSGAIGVRPSPATGMDGSGCCGECFFSHATNRLVAPRAALTKDRRTSFRFFSGHCASSTYKSCSVRWNLCLSPARRWRESPSSSAAVVVIVASVLVVRTEVEAEEGSEEAVELDR